MAFLAFDDGLGGTTNLLLRSAEFDNAAWSKNNDGAGSVPVVTANAGTAPDGTVTADQVVFVAPASGDQSVVAQDASVAITAGAAYVGSLFVKASATGDVGKTLIFRHAGRANYTPIVLTASWQRVSSVESAGTANNYMEIGLRPDQGGSAGTVTVLLWGTALNAGSVLTAYVPTTSATVTNASLQNDYPAPANRFSNWTPSTKPYGDSVNTLASGATVMFRHRTDYAASFDLVGIPVKAQADGVNYVAVADRLCAHLLSGGTVSVQTGDAGARIYPTCGLAPGSSPSLRMTDSRNLLYSLSVQVINLAATPVRLDAVYAP